MPLTIPPFVQFQSPMFPLRGLWNRAPVEGDQFVNAELDWLISPPGNTVQFSLSGNSPVALSQIVALSVDNGRCGVDVDFIFPDSGFVLTVPAHNQGLFPIFTNALMFYASAIGAAAGDTTILQILNSLPPPLPIPATEQNNYAATPGITIANGTFPTVVAGSNGTVNAFQLIASGIGGTGIANVFLNDGTGRSLWQTTLSAPAAPATQVFEMPGINVRYTGGLNLVVTAVTGMTGLLKWNVYYSTP